MAAVAVSTFCPTLLGMERARTIHRVRLPLRQDQELETDDLQPRLHAEMEDVDVLEVEEIATPRVAASGEGHARAGRRRCPEKEHMFGFRLSVSSVVLAVCLQATSRKREGTRERGP